jgi:hypothetical protein
VGSAPPAPLEWHPWYRNKTWLLDWLEHRGPYADLDVLRVPVPRRLSFTLDVAPSSTEPAMSIRVLTRRKACGPAPWTGRPFFYAWTVGTDDLGRHIAGDSRIVYE